MDENSPQRPEQLSMASRGKRDIQVLFTDFREAGVRRDLQMEELHETCGHSFDQYRDGQYYDVVREDREATRENFGVPRVGVHNSRQIGFVRIGARGFDLVGRQGAGRCVSVSFATGQANPALAMDQNKKRFA